MIKVQMLGGLGLQNAEGRELEAVLAQPRRLALLGYLAVARPHGFHRRDTILSLFWPERDAEHARASLNRALYFLRRELGDAVIVSRGDEEIGLDHRHVWCDTVAFEEASEGRRYRDAVELYRGELLPGFFISGASGFEEWLESQRSRLRDAASESALALAEVEETTGNVASAVHWARRGLELAPFSEVAFRRLLALLDRTGDRAGALHAYAKFANEMARELDVAPSPETRTLLEAIRARAPCEVRRDLPVSPTADPGAERAGSISSPVRPAAPPRSRRPWPRGAVWGGAVATVVLATLGVVLLPGNATSIDLLRVDVAPLLNRTGDRSFDRLGRLAAEGIVQALGQTGLAQDVRLFSGTSATRAGIEVRGAIEREDSRLRVELAIIDIRRGRKEWAIPPIYAQDETADQAIERIHRGIIGGIAVLRNASHASLLPLVSPPPAFDAYQEFLEGVKLQSQGQIANALQHYRWAAAIDSSFTWPLVHGGLVSLHWFRADLTAQADSFLQSLNPLRDRLPPIQGYLVDHMLAVRSENWAGSYRAIRAAAALAPEHYGYMLANKANQMNRPREAIAALTRPGMDSLYRGDVNGYWYVLTYSLHVVGEHRSELEQARRARRNQPQSGRALFEEIRALAALGRLAAVRARLDTLLQHPREGWFTAGIAMRLVAAELRTHGHSAAATETFERALAWYRSRPAEERGSQQWRELVGELQYAAGKWKDADTVFRALAGAYPASIGYPDNVAYLGRIGAIAVRLGDLTLARAMAARLETMDRAQPLPGQEAIVFRARIAAVLGEREHAMRLLREAYGVTGTVELHGDVDFEGMKRYPAFQEFQRPKG